MWMDWGPDKGAAREMWADRANAVCAGGNYVEKSVAERDEKKEEYRLVDKYIPIRYLEDYWRSIKTGIAECLGNGDPDYFEYPIVGRYTNTNDAGEFRSLISGNTASGKSENGITFHVFYAPDGSMSGIATDKSYTESEDFGTWEVTDAGQLCETWKKWRYRQQNCFVTTNIGIGQYRMKAIGKPFMDILSFRQGNPEGLRSPPQTLTQLMASVSAGQAPAGFTGPAEFDLTGIYRSKVHQFTSANYFCFNQRRVFQIDLKQENYIIRGKFLSGISGEIEGVLLGNKVRFHWYTARCSSLTEGEWTVSSDGATLDGYGEIELEWKAQKQN
jgi:hypothetical protein